MKFEHELFESYWYVWKSHSIQDGQHCWIDNDDNKHTYDNAMQLQQQLHQSARLYWLHKLMSKSK